MSSVPLGANISSNSIIIQHQLTWHQPDTQKTVMVVAPPHTMNAGINVYWSADWHIFCGVYVGNEWEDSLYTAHTTPFNNFFPGRSFSCEKKKMMVRNERFANPRQCLVDTPQLIGHIESSTLPMVMVYKICEVLYIKDWPRTDWLWSYRSYGVMWSYRCYGQRWTISIENRDKASVKRVIQGPSRTKTLQELTDTSAIGFKTRAKDSVKKMY